MRACLTELPSRLVSDLDRAISKYIVELVPDRATLQIGVGGVPNAVCSALTNHKDLGLHTELMTTSVAALIQSGAVSNKYKNINKRKNVYTLAAGNTGLYEFLHDNSSMEVYPVDYVNDPYVIGRNDQVVSINAFLQVSLDGEVNSETVNGLQYSAPGGQLDFVRGAQLSREGKSILAAYSTAAGGTVSRIVPQIEGPATDPPPIPNTSLPSMGLRICAANRARKGRKDLSPSRIPISGMRFAKEPESSATYRGTLCEKQARHRAISPGNREV